MKIPKGDGLTVKQSLNGLGLFAKKRFLQDEIIFEVTGTRISGDEDEDIDERTRDNAFRYDANSYISPQDTLGAYLNHSCEPNAKIDKRGKKLFIVALSDIKRGEEILIDYSTTLASDDVWRMKCNCKTRSCRKIIKRFTLLPKKLQATYRALHAVPAYID